jgi:hypothetical protein
MVAVDNVDEFQHDTSKDMLLDPSKVDMDGSGLQRSLEDKLDGDKIPDQKADVDDLDRISSEHHALHDNIRVEDSDDEGHRLVHDVDDMMQEYSEVEVEDEEDVLGDELVDVQVEDEDRGDEVHLSDDAEVLVVKPGVEQDVVDEHGEEEQVGVEAEVQVKVHRHAYVVGGVDGNPDVHLVDVLWEAERLIVVAYVVAVVSVHGLVVSEVVNVAQEAFLWFRFRFQNYCL